ncbi:MAG TPA: hypothetical protein PKC30_00465 [Saprospiraceae bacterium]|nr:hypothetical protein [Saprospiraceae bacterium]
MPVPVHIENKGPVSQLFLDKGIDTFQKALKFLRSIPYGRTSNKKDFSLVVLENKGTCSTKHALLSTLSKEQGWDQIELYLCFFRMKEENTPGIDSILKQQNLVYIPEAHCVIFDSEKFLDITSQEATFERIKTDLLFMEKINPEDVVDYKEKKHKGYIRRWKKEMKISQSFKNLWETREACITSLSY